MNLTAQLHHDLTATTGGCLPPRMRILFISGPARTGAWLAEAFAGDSASEVVLEPAEGIAEGLGRLREELFDAVLVSHEPDQLDALELMDAIRAGSGDEQPVIILGEESSRVMTALCYEAGADGYLCIHETTTRALIWTVSRAMERHELLSENRRLQQARKQRIQQEHDEVQRLLQQQRAMLTRAAGGNDCPSSVDDRCHKEIVEALPEVLVDHYAELLRSSVIMGSGHLTEEMDELSELFAAVRLSPQQALALHLYVLEQTIDGIGSRSARHVLNRADMLILEMMLSLASRYRRQLIDSLHPPRQQMLPGFDRWLSELGEPGT